MAAARNARWELPGAATQEANKLETKVKDFEASAAPAKATCEKIKKAYETVRELRTKANATLASAQKNPSEQGAASCPPALASEQNEVQQAANELHTQVKTLMQQIEELANKREQLANQIEGWGSALAPVLGKEACNLNDLHTRIINKLLSGWASRLLLATQACLPHLDDWIGIADDDASAVRTLVCPPTSTPQTTTSAPFCRNVVCVYSDIGPANESANFSDPPNAAWGNFSASMAALQKAGYVDMGNGNGYCPPFHCANAQSLSQGHTSEWYLNGDYSGGQCQNGDKRLNLIGTKSITQNPIFCVPPSVPPDPPIVPPPSYVPGTAAATPPPSAALSAAQSGLGPPPQEQAATSMAGLGPPPDSPASPPPAGPSSSGNSSTAMVTPPAVVPAPLAFPAMQPPTASYNSGSNVCNPTPPAPPKPGNICNSSTPSTVGTPTPPPPNAGPLTLKPGTQMASGSVNCGFCDNGKCYAGICGCQKASNGMTTCTGPQGTTCTTRDSVCYPPTAANPQTSSVAACSSKPPYLPWGGRGSATITVSGGQPCGVGWHDTPGGPGGVTVLDSMTVSSPPSHGTLRPQDQHVIIFTPTPGYKGQDSFTLSMREHNGGRSATLNVTVSVTIQ